MASRSICFVYLVYFFTEMASLSICKTTFFNLIWYFLQGHSQCTFSCYWKSFHLKRLSRSYVFCIIPNVKAIYCILHILTFLFYPVIHDSHYNGQLFNSIFIEKVSRQPLQWTLNRFPLSEYQLYLQLKFLTLARKRGA